MGDEKKTTSRGCIKTSRGPWRIRKATKNGGIITKYRFPTEKERLKNQQKERARRAVARNIFAGLRQHGNYKLPKHPGTNDLLKALCEEVGWHVEEDGTLLRKHQQVGISSLVNTATSSYYAQLDDHIASSSPTEELCNRSLSLSLSSSSTEELRHGDGGNDLKLSLSLPFSCSS